VILVQLTGCIVGMLSLILLAGCIGITDDYAKTALGMAENATGNTGRNLAQKHDLEAATYARLYCAEPRIGAVERRYKDPVHLLDASSHVRDRARDRVRAMSIVARFCRTLAFETLLLFAGVLDRLHAPDAASRVREMAGKVG
jgi:hypothetical protein